MTARPWMKFYTTDWSGDTKLRSCPMAARGLWMEMLCIMHEGEGRLAVNGETITDDELAPMVGMPEGECREAIAILEKRGVFSREPDGTIYSRRMRRDIEKSARAKANGMKGGSPRLKPEVNGQHKAQWNMASGLEEPTSQEEASTRARLDQIECEAREAAGVIDAPDAGLLDLSPLVTLLDQGYHWSKDILPKLREAKARGRFGRTWSYYVPAITDGKAKNTAIQPRASPTPSKQVIWRTVDDPEFLKLAERYQAMTGKRVMPMGSKHESGIGFAFPADLSSPIGERQ